MGSGASCVVHSEGERDGESSIVVRTGQGARKAFKFDRTFSPAANQGEGDKWHALLSTAAAAAAAAVAVAVAVK